MKKRNLQYVTIGILLVISLIYYINQSTPYGNDEESIVQVIQSIEGYEHKSIKLLEIKDFDKNRIVAFLANTKPGYIEFHANKKGNYEWKRIEINENESLSTFHFSSRGILYITNSENEIATLQVDVNGETRKQEFIPNTETVAWFELPESEDHTYEFRNYQYYDKDGNMMEEYE